MTPTELLGEVDRILAEAKTALLATLDAEGRPHMRWMTPARLRGRPGHLYAVTEAASAKLGEIQRDPRVTWLVQRASLNEIITLRGRAVVVDDALLLNEFLEAAGKDLFMVWRLQPSRERPQLKIIETAIERASRFDAGTGVTVDLGFPS